MTDKLAYPHLDRSQRLRIARTLSGLPREAFCKKYSISLYTLRSCELGHLTVSYKSADKVTKALAQEGIFCTTEWIMEGKGSHPMAFKKAGETKSLTSLSEEQVILREVDFFRKENASAVVLEVKDDAMFPFYKEGDIVGGKIIADPSQLLGKISLIEIRPELYVLRKLSKDPNTGFWVLSALNLETRISDPFLRLEKILSVAAVLWFRRNLKSALI
jgi:hypothetical protein